MSAENLRGMLDRLPAISVLENYIVPGLTSRLLAGTAGGGKLRVFEMARHQELYVVPHDHRYPFEAYVLSGAVAQIKYAVHEVSDPLAAEWVAVEYCHAARTLGEPRAYMAGDAIEYLYGEGDAYSMRSDEFHSIRFGRGARVLMAEGAPDTSRPSCVLLPMVRGRVCSTFQFRDWMMEEGGV